MKRLLCQLFHFAGILLSISIGVLLAGCEVTVDTRVKSNGTVVRRVIVDVPNEDFELVQQAAKQYLPDWKFESKRKTGKRQLICSQKFSAFEPEVVKTVTFRRNENRMRWFIPLDHYTYTEKISFQDFLTTKDKKAIASQTQVVYLLTLPGRPTHAPQAKKIQGRTAVWEAPMSEDVTLSVNTTAVRWAWGIVELLILALIAWVISPVIQWINETSARFAEKRKTARVARAARREAAAARKAAKRAAAEAARQQREAERQRRAAEKQQRQAERQRREEEKIRARAEAARRKEEARRAREEAKRSPEKRDK